MHIAIDLQGAQSGSRLRGIGRYSLSLTKAIIQNRGAHKVSVVLSSLFPESIDEIRTAVSLLLPAEAIHVWKGIGPTREEDSSNLWRRDVSERLRESFIAALQPDVVLISSLFEGLSDDAVTSIGLLEQTIPTSVILYDLIPLFNPDKHFRTSAKHQAWYARKLDFLKRSQQLLAISDSTRNEALSVGAFNESTVVNVSGACDSMFRQLHLSDEDKAMAWQRLGILRPFVMYTGGSDERKNLHKLILAYSLLPNILRRQYQLVLAGGMPPGDIEDYLFTARINGLAKDEIMFTGRISDEDLVLLYNTCALFAFPSLQEGLGLPPLEAMACGAPVIAANATSLPEVVGLRSALFDPREAGEITSKLSDALTNDDFRRELVDNGFRQVGKFSWQRSALAALSAMERLVPRQSVKLSSNLTVDRTSIFRKRKFRILVIKLDHFGDFILSIPALSKLRARYPYASITIIVGSWNVELARRLQLFDAIVSYDFFRQKSSDPPRQNEEALQSLLESIGNFNLALDLRRQPETRFLLARARASIKIAYATFDEAINRCLNVALPVYPEAAFRTTPLNKTSISLQMLAVIDAIPEDINDFIRFPDICDSAEKMSGAVAIFPMAGSSIREWSKPNFKELIKLLALDPLVSGVEIYIPSQQEASEFSFPESNKVKLRVGLELNELAKSLAAKQVCVANNSGGAHLASYLGVSVIGIYSGHELASEWGPQFFDSVTIHRSAECAPCHGGSLADCPNDLFCLSDISVSDVYKKVMESLTTASTDIPDFTGVTLEHMALQKNADCIVRDLLSSIANLGPIPQEDALAVAEVIAINHPDFSMSPDLRSFTLDHTFDHRSSRIDWRGFSTIESKFRWTDGNRASMRFECPDFTQPKASIHLHLSTLGKQRILLRLNGVQVLDTSKSSRNVRLAIPVENLRKGINELEFDLPNARSPGTADSRKLGIAIRSFRVEN